MLSPRKHHFRSMGEAYEKNQGEKGGGSTTKFTPKFDKFKQDKGKTSQPLATKERRICFKCKGYGHVIKDCPNNRVTTLRDIQEIDEVYASKEDSKKRSMKGKGMMPM